ncbi:hypothetical protein [Streptosporangium sp. NPDC048865]|uniref:hypothetical protein n=1 Tax=Streptosporangium sp. NPDC048865 TaxID=3155766 RepID=UPI0034475427
MTDRDREEKERGIWERVAEIERTLADRRAGAAEQALRKVAKLAAQHLADTRPQGGRPAVLGTLAGGPAVAHLAKLVLAITGPPPGRAGEEHTEAAPERTTNEWYWASGLRRNVEPPEPSTEEYRWWEAGARYEHNLHTEGLGKDVLEVLKTAQNLARIDPTATAADLAALLAKLYPQAEADAPPAAMHVTSPGAWLAALDILRRREQVVWSFLIRRCAGIAVEKAEDDRPRLVATFDGPALADRFLTLTHEGRRYADILIEALHEVTSEDWWVAADPGYPEPAVPLVDEAAVEERVRADIAARLRTEKQDCDNHPWPGWGASCWTCGRNGMLARAESIALGQGNPPAGQERLDVIPEYGTDAYRWWLAGIRRAQQLRAQTIGDDALAALETAEDIARRRPDITAADLVDELAALYPQPEPVPLADFLHSYREASGQGKTVAQEPPAEPLAGSLERRPHVVAAPWLFFGRPALARTGTDTLAAIGLYLAGDAPETVLAELGLTRGEFLTICWWEAHWGTRTKEWAAWRDQHAGALGEGHWRGYDDIPYPPRPDAGGQHTGGEPGPDPAGSSTASRLVAKRLLTREQVLDSFDYPEAVMTAALTHATRERTELAALTSETIREAIAKLRAAPMYPPYRLDGLWRPKETVPPVPGLPVRETKENPAPDPEAPDELDELDVTDPGLETEDPEEQTAEPCSYLDDTAQPVVGVDLGADGEAVLTVHQRIPGNQVTITVNEAAQHSSASQAAASCPYLTQPGRWGFVIPSGSG